MNFKLNDRAIYDLDPPAKVLPRALGNSINSILVGEELFGVNCACARQGFWSETFFLLLRPCGHVGLNCGREGGCLKFRI